ncbi:trichohyalin-like isoform X3 [Mya arenaria]|uniref:trichohyalin-like isoform X3 n=1 Tax=Mya arenaria TaxID=6604 RepID=UPI0022E4FA1C|nr:trichohyalin-like isoform X3 [Mya arenaria]
MNYSVFRLQNQGGRPSIFWEKETIPKKDRKFGYKQRNQRFQVRRFAGDDHHVETDLVSLTPDEPPPPPKPVKNFIKKNKAKVSTQKQDGTVTLTQEQLNAILRSVGKVAGGSENAVKISIDRKDKTHSEVLVESPRRHDDDEDDDYDDHQERRRKKKPASKQEDNSIYSFLGDQSKKKNTSDNESIASGSSDRSLELRRVTKSHARRKEKKSRRKDDDYEDDDRPVRGKQRHRIDDDDEPVRDRGNKTRSKRDTDYNMEKDDNKRKPRRHQKTQEELDDEILNYNNSRPRIRLQGEDSDSEIPETRGRRNRSKHRDSDDEGIELDRKERTKKSERHRKDESFRERRRDRSRKESEEDEQDTSLNKDHADDENLQPSPRDKIGLPIDLSWRHMTKAERRRLEMARMKVDEDEEKKEEERLKQLNARYNPEVILKPQRHKGPRSDPSAKMTRTDIGRVTDLSNYTDGNRRGRHSRSPSPEDTPDVPSRHSPVDTSPKAHAKAPVGIPMRHMTLAEKKRLEWDRERVESKQLSHTGDYDPWGRPGAGAPLRTRSGHVAADYKGRQDMMHTSTIVEEGEASEQGTRQEERGSRPRGRSPPTQKHRAHSPPSQQLTQQGSSGAKDDVPHAMRSSFVLGQGAPNNNHLESAKERERKKWLAELEQQIEEKRLKDLSGKPRADEETWADKLGHSHRPTHFPDQPRDPGGGGAAVNASVDGAIGSLLPLESHRDVHSAPDGNQDGQSHIRGQNVPLDPTTKKELEDKRRRYLEHQDAVKAQVEEKERQRRQAREAKLREDMEEERKLQDERNLLKTQFEMEQQKSKQKEQQRQAQVNQLKAAMDEAQASALQEKYQRKMQHLEAGGHDTSKLREHLEGEITTRIEQLNTRRERDIKAARQLHDLQFWGLTPNEADEDVARQHGSVRGQGQASNHRQQGQADHSQGARLTPRDRGDIMVVEPSHVPGLDLHTGRTQGQPNYTTRREPRDQRDAHDPATSVRHEPYQEDRVLTPSRFRHPAKPWSDPASPRREFGTQTGKLNDSAASLDGDDVSHLLNSHILSRDDSEVNIQYKFEKGKKVRVISAPKESLQRRGRKPKESRDARDPRAAPSHRGSVSPHEHHHEVVNQKMKEEQLKKKKIEQKLRRGPVKQGSRPMWGYKNPNLKKPQKQSEKDPFYDQKKKESEARRVKREHKLLALVEANKDIIPDYYVPPTQRTRSRSRSQSPYSDIEMASPRQATIKRRSKSHSPDSFRLPSNTDQLPGQSGAHGKHRRRESVSPPPHAHGHATPQEYAGEDNRSYDNRNKSPPVPAIRHKDSNRTAANAGYRKGGKYDDDDPLQVPVQNGEFVPFTRTVDILDPAKAEEPLPLSREATRVANARRKYYESLHPNQFGNRQYPLKDEHRPLPGNDPKNPLMNPGLVLEHPTSRQDQILVQLSTLKQSLMQRQRELETFSPTDLVRYNTDIKA